MAKTIYYVPKITSAKTEYREISEDDHNWLIQQMLCGLVKMGAIGNSHNEDFKLVRTQYWHRRRAALPKGRDGQNTPESFIAGILDNMLYSDNPQRDFTAKQMEGIEDIFNWLSAVDSCLEEVRFMIRVF